LADARLGGEADVSAPAARAIAADVDAIRRRPLPEPVLARARALLLDYLGVTLAGAPEESSVVLGAASPASARPAAPRSSVRASVGAGACGARERRRRARDRDGRYAPRRLDPSRRKRLLRIARRRRSRPDER
jgi:hypothetical protein